MKINGKGLFIMAGFVLFYLPALASIDTRQETSIPFHFETSEVGFEHVNYPAQEGKTRFDIQPLYLNRNLSVLTRFSTLPENFQLTLKQFYITHQWDNKTRLGAKGTGLEDRFADSKGQDVLVELSHPVVAHSLIHTETFFGASKSDQDPEETSIFFGARGNGSLFNLNFNGEFSYEDQIASQVSSPAFKAVVSSSLAWNASFPSEVKLAWQYAEERGIDNDLQDLYAEERPQGNIYAPTISNISILNVSLACAPVQNMFFSLDYYYYLQDKLQIQSFANNRSRYSGTELTTGESRDLGQELNFIATYSPSDLIISKLFAGWFDPGSAYAQVDDNKTFEIRGEIIVNF